MTSTNEQHNRTTTQHARAIRIILLQLGVFGMLLGAPLSQAKPLPTPQSDRGGQQGNIPHVSQFDPSLLLEMTVNAILELIDQINDIQVAQTGSTLEDSADILTFGYTVFGLEEDLTPQQMNIGLQDCQDALDILQDPDNSVDLSETSKYALELTLEDMILELDSEL